MDWSIQEIARLTGTTSRTLRHYGDVGLLEPSRIGSNGYRYYDEASLVRLQRVLLLRELGLGLPAIGEVLSGEMDAPAALGAHLEWLRREQSRLTRQIASVESTVRSMKGGEQLMAENMFDGFDHTEYKEEVESRWGAEAYASSDAWWRGMSADEKQQWLHRQESLAGDWRAAAARRIALDGDEAQALAARQVEWLEFIPGTPRGSDGRLAKAYVIGLGEMYAADERFAANYGGADGAALVRDALTVYADREL